MRKFYFILLACILPVSVSVQAVEKKIKIVVLGSSTAAGAGPTNTANAWVNQFLQYVKNTNASNEVINLAVGGYTTYQVMPSDFTVPTDRPSPNVDHNITKALSYAPDAIIVNLPTNDASLNYTVTEQLSNYRAIKAKAAALNIPVYIATTQPRNASADQRANLMAVRDSINAYYGTKAIDFWTTIANPDGTINATYNSGDGVHLNDAAHTILKDRVIATDIMTYSKAVSTRDTINIDFGDNISTGKWNNLNVATADTVLNLVGTQNGSTGISIWIHDAFTGINNMGTTTPAAAINMPSSATSDSFFGSVGAHNSVVEATGGFTMSGLDKNTLYSFTFFASRTGISDNRETKYKIVGATKDSVALDAANNTTNTASINNIKCNPNGTLTITVSPGPNNTNASKYYFIGAMRITSEKQEVTTNYDPDGTVNIDFGGSKLSSGTWNNMSIPSGAQILSDLVNTEGNSTGISLSVHDAFTGINDLGAMTPDASLGIESNGASDSFFGSVGLHSGVSEPTGGVTLSGLSVNSNYTLSFFASRDGVADNRETKYTVTGSTTASANLDAANNKSNMVTVPLITPAADGTIKIDVAPGTNNTNSVKYYYLGVMRIVYAPKSGTAVTEISAENAVAVYPNPFTDEVTFSSAMEGALSVKIFDISGRLVHTLCSAAGENTIKWDGVTSAGIRVKSGMYLCQISTGNNAKVISCKLQVK